LKTPPDNEGVSNNDIINAFRTLLLNERDIHEGEFSKIIRILSFCKGVFASDAAGQAFIYLCKHRATTAWLLQIRLDMPEATAYRILKRLRRLKLIEPVLKLPKSKTGRSGPIPKVWGLVDNWKNRDIANCINLHYRSLSPKYRAAEQVAQDILDNYIKPHHLREVSYKELLVYIKEMKVPFRTPDIADLAARYLHEQGVKVWR